MNKRVVFTIALTFISFLLVAQIRERTAYTVDFDSTIHQARCVSYLLTKEMLIKNVERRNYFKEDSDLNTATKDDYYKSGLDRGHLVPAADMLFSEITMKESFLMSNITPQYPSFNRGIWKRLENKVRGWCQQYDSVYVQTGVIVSQNSDFLGDSVPIPSEFFKVAVISKGEQFFGIGFILPNSKEGLTDLSEYILTIDEVEKAINYDLFEFINDESAEKFLFLNVWELNY